MFDVSFVYKIIDKFSGPSNKIQSSAAATEGKLKRMANGASRLNGKIQSAGASMRSFATSGAALATGALAGAFTIPIRKAVELETALASMSKVIDFTSEQAKSGFIETISELGAKLGISQTEIIGLAEGAAKLGTSTKDIPAFIELAKRASVSLDDLTISEAGFLLGDLQTKFKENAAGAELMMDAVNILGDSTNARGTEIIRIMKQIPGVFTAIDMDPTQAAGFAAVAQQLAPSMEKGATGIRLFFKQLDQAGLTNNPLATVNEELDRLAKMSINDRALEINTKFGGDAAPFVAALVSNPDVLAESMALVSDKASFQGRSVAESDIQMDTAAQQMAQFSATIDRVTTKIGTALIPALKSALDAVTPFISKVSDFVAENPGVVKAAAGFAAVAAAIVGIAAVVGVFSLLLTPIGAIGAAVAAVIAGVLALKVGITKMIEAVSEPLSKLSDSFGGLVSGAASTVGEFFGFGGDDLAVAGPAGAAAALAGVDGNAGAGAAEVAAGGQTNRLDGNINVAVDGPGKVTNAEIKTDMPGNVGANVGMVR